ncbi:MAG: GatB/YqeY domain-containing protein [Clostridia bacterium]|nr:GatB/YqeY domain-containing protein [Clostridia bacterium]MBR1676195.1 GatB/YqeY domain-containing protein [Clostridia bacterium]
MQIEDFKKVKIDAMKAHDKDAVTALNAVINKLMLAGIEKKAAGETMGDEDVVRILQKTINELKEEREGFVKAGREETVLSLDNQIATVEKYLPKMLSEEEIAAIINGLDDKSTPAVMKHFKAEYAGKVDMRLVGTVLKGLQ